MDTYDRYIAAQLCGRPAQLGRDVRSRAHRKMDRMLRTVRRTLKFYAYNPFVNRTPDIPKLKQFADKGLRFPKSVVRQFHTTSKNIPYRPDADLGCGPRVYKVLCWKSCEETPDKIAQLGRAELRKAMDAIDPDVPRRFMSFRSYQEIARFLKKVVVPQLRSVYQHDFPRVRTLKIPKINVHPAEPGLTGAYFVTPRKSCRHPSGYGHGSIHVQIENLHHVDMDELSVILAHELCAGHYYQFYVAGRSMRSFVIHNWFIEGWALYVEKFMDVLGPAHRNARLRLRCLRAARCIIDPYIHNARRRSLRCAVNKYQQLLPFMDRHLCTQDVLRYASMPAQACSYLVGCRRFERWAPADPRRLMRYHARILKTPLGPLAFVRKKIVASRSCTK